MDESSLKKGFKVNYASLTPIYSQLAQYLKLQIKTGALKPGEKMMPEETICKVTNISRSTVRQAISILVEQGQLIRYRGKGTFISEQKFQRHLNRLYNFTGDMTAMGITPSSRTLKQEILDVSGTDIPEKLEMADGQTKVFHLVRVRMADRQPVLIEDTCIPYYLCQGIETRDFENASLYETLKNNYNLTPYKAVESLQGIIIPAKEQKILKCGSNTVGYRITRTARLSSDLVYEYTVSITRADLCAYQFQLSSAPAEKSNSFVMLKHTAG
jgi:GntR family transcriptional regulator